MLVVVMATVVIVVLVVTLSVVTAADVAAAPAASVSTVAAVAPAPFTATRFLSGAQGDTRVRTHGPYPRVISDAGKGSVAPQGSLVSSTRSTESTAFARVATCPSNVTVTSTSNSLLAPLRRDISTSHHCLIINPR